MRRKKEKKKTIRENFLPEASAGPTKIHILNICQTINIAEQFIVETFLPEAEIDELIAEMSKRLKAYEKLHSLFGFLIKLKKISNAKMKINVKIF